MISFLYILFHQIYESRQLIMFNAYVGNVIPIAVLTPIEVKKFRRMDYCIPA